MRSLKLRWKIHFTQKSETIYQHHPKDSIKDHSRVHYYPWFFFSGKVSAALFSDLCTVWGDAPIPEEKGRASEENVGERREGNDWKDEKK